VDQTNPAASTQAPTDAVPAIATSMITGVVLAGGRGARMGGLDKGLQLFDGEPLALFTLRRLQQQVGPSMLNANRNEEQYQAFGVPVYADSLPDYAGPLAGFITALQHCDTPYLVTVPCDTPLFPSDLVPRMARALVDGNADIAVASAPESDTHGNLAVRAQPVFCLMARHLLPSLTRFVAAGGRKIDAWTAHHKTVLVPFEDAGAFTNANTLAQLQALQP
jgi:molybdopterin-guanine dinucleotide biosynthesis protein A